MFVSETQGVMLWAALTVLTGWLFPCVALAAGPPPQAAAAGYTVNTFSTTFTASNIDLTNSCKSGYSWYLFDRRTDRSAIMINPDQSVTLKGDTLGPNGELITVAAAEKATFVGTAFGGGAYIEAELQFSPEDVARAENRGWPAFWSLPLESSVLHTAQWPGQSAGYIHSIEADFLEYMDGGPKNRYGASLHDWYGVPDVTCPHGLCQVGMPFSIGTKMAPDGHDFNTYHRYGFLWVQATDDKKGYARFYLDGKSIGTEQQWTKYSNQPPPPTNQPWAFGQIDRQHMVLILGTGPNEPMRIRSVNVWQASASGNLHN